MSGYPDGADVSVVVTSSWAACDWCVSVAVVSGDDE